MSEQIVRDVANPAQLTGEQLTRLQGELTGYCYRMLGSPFDAEDAVQETMIRAWRRYETFEGRSSLRAWLYRIATNVCLDQLNGRQRRVRPVDMSAPSVRPRSPGEALADATWIEPIPDARIVTTADDPADVAETRDSVHLAFVAALQYLPPMQRAVLLLRDVMGLSAIEGAQLLGKSVASVNSSLQRARATLADQRARSDDSPEPLNDAQRALLTQYVDAFSRYDMDTLAMLMHIDAIMSMPPHTMWMKGLAEIQAWLLGPGVECRGSRLVPTFANAMPAFGQYRPSKLSDGYEPWALHVIEISAGRITALNVFRDTERFFPLFGLPDHLAA